MTTLADKLKVIRTPRVTPLDDKIEEDNIALTRLRYDFHTFLRRLWEDTNRAIDKGKEPPARRLPEDFRAYGLSHTYIKPALNEPMQHWMKTAKDEGMTIEMRYEHDGCGVEGWITVFYDVMKEKK
jgi:hypothetical protein